MAIMRSKFKHEVDGATLTMDGVNTVQAGNSDGAAVAMPLLTEAYWDNGDRANPKLGVFINADANDASAAATYTIEIDTDSAFSGSEVTLWTTTGIDSIGVGDPVTVYFDESEINDALALATHWRLTVAVAAGTGSVTVTSGEVPVPPRG